MEDAHVIVDNFGDDPGRGFFAIYDGHGGKQAVEFVEKTLHKNLLEELKRESKILEAMKQAFITTDEQLGQQKIMFSGTTVVAGLVVQDGTDRILYVANAGDARAVVCEEGKALRLTKDHKGSDEAEQKRIVEAGGFVVMNRVNGILAVTRSLGDRTMKDYVIGEPFTTETILTEKHTHLILACDGVWDVLSDQDAMDIVVAESDAKKMAERLVIESLKLGSTDNISAMVIVL